MQSSPRWPVWGESRMHTAVGLTEGLVRNSEVGCWTTKPHLRPVGAEFKHGCPTVCAGVSLEHRVGLWCWSVKSLHRVPCSGSFLAWSYAITIWKLLMLFEQRLTHTHLILEAHVISPLWCESQHFHSPGRQYWGPTILSETQILRPSETLLHRI